MVRPAASPANPLFSGRPLILAITVRANHFRMKQLRHSVIRAGLEALYFTGAHYLLRPIFAGVGAIFMLHQVRPGRGGAFQPNRHLEVTPEFLRATLLHLRTQDIDVIPMDEVHRRLVERDFSRRFACFTFGGEGGGGGGGGGRDRGRWVGMGKHRGRGWDGGKGEKGRKGGARRGR